MKKIFLNLLLCAFSLSLQAKTFTYSEEQIIPKSVDEVFSILVDYENYCERGCPYRLENVEEIRLFGNSEDEEHVTWTSVSGMKSFQYFTKVHWYKKDGVLKLLSRMPSKREARSLRSQHQLSHAPFFTTQNTSWSLEEVTDQYGRTVTKVGYSILAKSNSWTARTFSTRIKKEIKKSAKVMFSHLNSGVIELK